MYNNWQFEPGEVGNLWCMLRLSAHSFVEAVNWLSKIDDLARNNPDSVYGVGGCGGLLKTYIENLKEHLSILDLPLSEKKREQIVYAIDSKCDTTIKANIISQKLGDLRERIEQELEQRALFCVSPRNMSILNDKDMPFGLDVAKAFPRAIPDLAEATMCIVMSRPTAAVFHLMRAMEAALVIAGEKLGATVIDRNNKELEWGKIIANMKGEIEKLPSGGKKDDWSAALGMLYHVGKSWRNNTMHPRETHTEEEAFDIFSAVKAFMKSLSALVLTA